MQCWSSLPNGCRAPASAIGVPCLIRSSSKIPGGLGDRALADYLNILTELSPEDLTLVARFIDALVTKTRLKVLAGGNRVGRSTEPLRQERDEGPRSSAGTLTHNLS